MHTVLPAQEDEMQTIQGTEIINGEIRLGHLWHEVDVIFDVLVQYRINDFVEIGVHEGGLTWLLLQRFPELNYLGLEINLAITKASVKNKVKRSLTAELIQRDCFDPNTLIDVLEWMPVDRPCLIYCDNGNKPLEIKTYAPILRTGDILMAHDYHDGRRVVRGLERYGYTTDITKPEVLPEDVAFMYENCKELDKVDLSDTRIIGFIAV